MINLYRIWKAPEILIIYHLNSSMPVKITFFLNTEDRKIQLLNLQLATKVQLKYHSAKSNKKVRLLQPF